VNIEVTARDQGVSERMKSYGSDKASKLVRYFDRISRILVVLETVHDTRRVEMVVHVDSGATLVGEERHTDMFAAIDLLVDKMERQLTKHKEKLHERNRQRPPAPAPAPGGHDGEDPRRADAPEVTYEEIIRREIRG
jgi:putative sigma-54 modulation protein